MTLFNSRSYWTSRSSWIHRLSQVLAGQPGPAGSLGQPGSPGPQGNKGLPGPARKYRWNRIHGSARATGGSRSERRHWTTWYRRSSRNGRSYWISRSIWSAGTTRTGGTKWGHGKSGSFWQQRTARSVTVLLYIYIILYIYIYI